MPPRKEADPRSPDRNRADDLMKTGRPAEAVPIYRKWVEAHPDEDSHLLALAWALHDSGKTAEAAVCFEQLFRKELSRKLFTGFAYDELVRIYREGKNGEALLSVCERAAAAQPEDTGILQTLGEAYLSAGRAVRRFGCLKRWSPANRMHRSTAVRSAMPGLPRASLEEAEAEYNRAAEIDPAADPPFSAVWRTAFFAPAIRKMQRRPLSGVSRQAG